MADPVLQNSASGESSVATTTASFGFTATAGRLLVASVGADDYKTGDPSGFTLVTGGSQQTFLGHYLWYKIAAGGETSFQYTIGSAARSVWGVVEYDNIDTTTPLDTSNGQFAQASGDTYTTPAITPSTGRRLVLAAMGATENLAGDLTGITTWLNSYTEVVDVGTSAGQSIRLGIASLLMDGDGSTATSSGCTFTSPSGSPQARTGIIAAFKVASGGDTTAPVLSSPTGTATGSSTATVGATTDEGNGTLYAVVTTSSTQPSVAQIKAGQDHTGAASAWSGSQAVSSTGAKTLSATGLSVTTAYYAHLVHTDAAANDSNRVSSAAFTTFQRSAPASDVSAGSWTASSGSDLFAMIDEATPSDADYIKTATAADVCTVALGSLSDPSASTGHQVSYRISGDGTSGMQVDLLQGTTVIATWTHDPAPASPTTYSQTLTGTQADSIADYTALRLRFTEI